MIILEVGGVDIIGHSLRRTSFHIQTILSMPLSSGAEDVLRAYIMRHCAVLFNNNYRMIIVTIMCSDFVEYNYIYQL